MNYNSFSHLVPAQTSVYYSDRVWYTEPSFPVDTLHTNVLLFSHISQFSKIHRNKI